MSAPHRALDIRRAIARQIVDGVWGPGERLPGRSALLDEFGGSMSTLQAAMAMLVDEGILETHGGHGTRVTDHPPCLRRIIMAFRREDRGGLVASLQAVLDACPPWCIEARAVSGIDGADWQAIADDLEEARCFAAILLCEACDLAEPLRLVLARHRVVVVGFMSDGFPRVHLDLYRSVQWAIGRCAEARHRRVAVLLPERPSARLADACRLWLVEAGLDDDPVLVQEASVAHPHGATGILRLWAALPVRRRPQALVVADDHLLPSVRIGLEAEPAFSPMLLAHGNHPGLEAGRPDEQRYGFEASAVLAAALELVSADDPGDRTITLRPQLLPHPTG